MGALVGLGVGIGLLLEEADRGDRREEEGVEVGDPLRNEAHGAQRRAQAAGRVAPVVMGDLVLRPPHPRVRRHRDQDGAAGPEDAQAGIPTAPPPSIPSGLPDGQRVTEARPGVPTARAWAELDGDRMVANLAIRIEMLEGDRAVAALSRRIEMLEADHMVAGLARRIGALEDMQASRGAVARLAEGGETEQGSDAPIILAEAWIKGLQPDVAAALMERIATVSDSSAD